MTEAVEKQLIRARPVKVQRRHADGSTYKATDWVVEPVASIADALQPVKTYRLDTPKPRKPRTPTLPCKFCGEVHPITQVDYCGGCGAKLDERTIEPKTAEECGSDILSDPSSAESPTENPILSPTPIRIVRSFVRGTHHNPHDEPAWLRDAPESPPDDGDLPPPRTLFPLPPTGCRSCGAAIAEGQTHCCACDPRTA
jgi:hypothetical protein